VNASSRSLKSTAGLHYYGSSVPMNYVDLQSILFYRPIFIMVLLTGVDLSGILGDAWRTQRLVGAEWGRIWEGYSLPI